ncbi:jerky protein homolog-like [Bactrocera dorsalis]|uniref:Jerky protein homolog-like n=1 Tax=Bactrocera dorsalis TaxID=27457 RepID=A0ABM3J9X3_BACDO|nr:jerky protein homolog-like [Bactrocera dorsalis]XP_049306023.1 jerky protein homolog-like [Bactrocera dorsalis]
MVVTRKLIKLTIKEKTEILDKLESGVSTKALCIDYKVHKSTITRIKKKKTCLLKYATNMETGPGKRQTLKSCEFPRMEKALYKWFLKQRSENVPISFDIVKAKARKLHEKIKEKTGFFHASNGWVSNFKKRYGLRQLKICGEKLSNKTASVDPFVIRFRNKIKELDLSAEQIYNADESGLFFRQMPDKTLVSLKESSAPGRKVSKERITFLACTNASGTHKVKLFVIGKAKNPRTFKNFQKMPVVYKANKNSWMTYLFFEDWFHHTFVPEVREFLESKGLPKKALLVLDNAPCYLKDNEMKSDDGMITVMCLPPNCTAILQPMDQNVINLTKVYYKKSLLEHLIGNKTTHLEEKIKEFNLRHAICLLASSWEKVSATSIRKCWNMLVKPDVEWSEEDDIPLSILKREIENERAILVSMLQELAPNDSFTNEELNEWMHESAAYQEVDKEAVEIENSDDSEADVIPHPKMKGSVAM